MIDLRTTQSSFLDYRAEIVSAGTVIGNVFLYNNTKKGFYEDWFDLEIDLEDDEALDAVLQATLEKAFEEIGAASVHCVVRSYDNALETYLKAGFTAESEKGCITQLSITTKQYFN